MMAQGAVVAMAVVLDPEQTETRVLRDLVDVAHRDVVEIGCGNGRLTWRYARRARSVLALDPDANAIAQARAGLPARLRERVTFAVADITTAEIPLAAFDVALLSWSLC